MSGVGRCERLQSVGGAQWSRCGAQHEPQWPCDLTVHPGILERQSMAGGICLLVAAFQPEPLCVAEQFCGAISRLAWNSSQVSSENSLSAAVQVPLARALISATSFRDCR